MRSGSGIAAATLDSFGTLGTLDFLRALNAFNTLNTFDTLDFLGTLDPFDTLYALDLFNALDFLRTFGLLRTLGLLDTFNLFGAFNFGDTLDRTVFAAIAARAAIVAAARFNAGGFGIETRNLTVDPGGDHGALGIVCGQSGELRCQSGFECSFARIDPGLFVGCSIGRGGAARYTGLGVIDAAVAAQLETADDAA